MASSLVDRVVVTSVKAVHGDGDDDGNVIFVGVLRETTGLPRDYSRQVTVSKWFPNNLLDGCLRMYESIRTTATLQ